MEMTKEKLEEYRSAKAEKQELQYKLDHLGEEDSLIGNDVILDYRKGYPRPQPIVGYDYNLAKRQQERWIKRISKLQDEIGEVEAWIEAIPDSLTRRCFRMVYMDGMTQKQAGKRLHLDRSRVSRKIDDFLKNAHKAQNAHV